MPAGPSAWAQNGVQSPPPVHPMPAPFSRDCQVGNTATATVSPLPNVAAALAKNKRIKILAIGASASAGPGAAYVTGQVLRVNGGLFM